MVIGARSRTFIDYSFGLVPWAGQAVTIDIPNSTSFGLVLSTVFFTVFPEGGAGYTIGITQ
jgi:hypothetical protein